MMRWLVVLLMMLMPLATVAQGNDPKALGRVTHESVKRAGVAFDPAQSRGVFIGINLYTAQRGVKPSNLKSCVNDAVDLAAAFMDLGLITGQGITIALSGEPTKPSSVEALSRLLAAGAVRLPDARRDTISDAVYTAADTAGPDGILFLTWSAHGFEAGGVQYLTPANFSSATEKPSAAEIQGAAIAESTLAAIAQSSKAQRRVLLFDACRETRSMTVGVPQLIAAAAGTVTLYAVTSGELALDGTRNGAFTEKVLGALTGPPPAALKADRNGHITVGTLLDYLGTAGRIEDPKILAMPLREDPRVAGQAQSRDIALVHFTAAKQVDIAAVRSERMLDAISLGALEDALHTAAGPELVGEAIALLDTQAKRADFRNRRSFAAAWRDSKEKLGLSESATITGTAPPISAAGNQATTASAGSLRFVEKRRPNPESTEEALDKLELLAYESAFSILGTDSLNKSTEAAVRRLEALSASGDPIAQGMMAIFLRHGANLGLVKRREGVDGKKRIIERDLVEADTLATPLLLEKLEAKARERNAWASYVLAMVYAGGIGSPSSEAKILHHLDAACSLGLERACIELASLQERGLLGNDGDPEQAKLTRSRISDPDSFYTQEMQMSAALVSAGANKDPELYLKTIDALARQGNTLAALRGLLIAVDGTMIERNEDKALEYAALALHSGERSVAQSVSALLYSSNLGTRSREAAIRLQRDIDGGGPDTLNILNKTRDEIVGKNVEWLLSYIQRRKDSWYDSDEGKLANREIIWEDLVGSDKPFKRVPTGIAGVTFTLGKKGSSVASSYTGSPRRSQASASLEDAFDGTLFALLVFDIRYLRALWLGAQIERAALGGDLATAETLLLLTKEWNAEIAVTGRAEAIEKAGEQVLKAIQARGEAALRNSNWSQVVDSCTRINKLRDFGREVSSEAIERLTAETLRTVQSSEGIGAAYSLLLQFEENDVSIAYGIEAPIRNAHFVATVVAGDLRSAREQLNRWHPEEGDQYSAARRKPYLDLMELMENLKRSKEPRKYLVNHAVELLEEVHKTDKARAEGATGPSNLNQARGQLAYWLGLIGDESLLNSIRYRTFSGSPDPTEVERLEMEAAFAKGLAKKGRTKEAVRLLGSQPLDKRYSGLKGIVEIMLELKQKTELLSTLRLLKESLDAAAEPKTAAWIHQRVYFQCLTARSQHLLGNTTARDEAFREALRLNKTIPAEADTLDQLYGYMNVAGAQLECDTSSAALSTTRLITSEGNRINWFTVGLAWGNVASYEESHGSPEKAQQVMDQIPPALDAASSRWKAVDSHKVMTTAEARREEGRAKRLAGSGDAKGALQALEAARKELVFYINEEAEEAVYRSVLDREGLDEALRRDSTAYSVVERMHHRVLRRMIAQELVKQRGMAAAVAWLYLDTNLGSGSVEFVSLLGAIAAEMPK